VTSAVALGGAIGPVVGGLAGDLFGLRLVFLGGGVALFLAIIPVVLIVRESPLVRVSGRRLSTLAVINQKPGLDRALAVLIGSQGLISTVNAATQQLVVLRLLELLSNGVSAVSGLGFGLSGLCSSAAAIGYTRVTARLGYVRTAALAAGLAAVAVAALGVAPWAAMIVVTMALNGLFSGVVLPATASMIGLETPSEAQSTVFGLNASSVALGFALGPLIGGGVAATSGVQASLFVVAGLAVLLAILIARGAREPAR
jgi:MFS family permease